MQLSIYLTIAFVAFTAARKLDVGPHVFSETQSHKPTASHKPGKRYVTQEYTLYLTPDEIKALQGTKSSENIQKPQNPKNFQSEQQNDEDQQLKWYNSQFLPEAPQLEIRGLAAHDAFFQNQKSNSEINQGKYQYVNLYSEETPREELKEIKSLTEQAQKFEDFFNWQKKQENINQGIDLQNDSKQKSQSEIRGLASQEDYLQKQKSDSQTQRESYQYINLYSEGTPKEEPKNVQSLTDKVNNFAVYYDWQKKQEEKTKQESDLQNEAKWKPYYTVSANNQEDAQLNKQLKEQWNRILDHNRAQLKSISPVPKESQESKFNEKSAEQIQLNKNSEIEKEIENILRDHRAFESAQQSGISLVEGIDKRPPILIHKEVSVTKHLPVPFVKKVKVPVPTPVLVPVPEPYEVKVPHPYPVLYKL